MTGPSDPAFQEGVVEGVQWTQKGVVASAPAKLNLFLHITGRRPDGMHELQTIFQFLSWADRLSFQVLSEPRLEEGAALPGIEPESDLALRAARLLAERTGYRGGVRLSVDKRLPVGAGLGGGSSDAATVLLVLNRLWGLGLSRSELTALATELGADVAAFIGGLAAWAEGVGERLTPIPEIPEPWYLVLWPGELQISTREVFADAALTRDHPPVTINDFYRGLCENDFTPVVERRHPEIAGAREWLDRYAPTPGRLSGSGACLFAACESHDQADSLRKQVPSDWEAMVARGCNRHPLEEWAFSGGSGQTR